MWNKMHSWQGEERSRRWKYDCHLGFGLDRARLRSIDQPIQSRTRTVFRKDKNISYHTCFHKDIQAHSCTYEKFLSSFLLDSWTKDIATLAS